MRHSRWLRTDTASHSFLLCKETASLSAVYHAAPSFFPFHLKNAEIGVQIPKVPMFLLPPLKFCGFLSPLQLLRPHGTMRVRLLWDNHTLGVLLSTRLCLVPLTLQGCDYIMITKLPRDTLLQLWHFFQVYVWIHYSRKLLWSPETST